MNVNRGPIDAAFSAYSERLMPQMKQVLIRVSSRSADAVRIELNVSMMIPLTMLNSSTPTMRKNEKSKTMRGPHKGSSGARSPSLFWSAPLLMTPT